MHLVDLSIDNKVAQFPSRTRYLLDSLKTKSYLLETYLIDNYLVTYCHLLKICFLNIKYISFLDILNISIIHLS
jgi:hypothetical protein